jgi:FAD/FMN-containing dehydrogenase
VIKAMKSKLDQRFAAAVPEGVISRAAGDISASLTDNVLVDQGVTPSAAIRPKNVEELAELIKLSNEVGQNLTVTASTGRHARGGIAAESEHVIIDLAQWKGIEYLDRRNRVALIRPGVTYGELSAALQQQGMVIPMPMAPRSGKSVVASVTDREATTWPNKQWDWGDPVGSTEVVFGNGSLFRTGSAGGPGTLEQQRKSGGAQKYSGGPSQTDLHRVVQGSQGTIGIVTWITIRAEAAPTVQRPLLIGTDGLETLIGFVYEVQRPGLGEHAFILNGRALDMLMAGSGLEAPGASYDTLPPYVCCINVAGFERLARQRLRYQERDIRDIAQRYGVSPAAEIGAVSAEGLLSAATRPCGEVDWRSGPSGDCLSIFFLTTLDKIPSLITVFRDIARAHSLEDRDVGIYIQPVVQNHACHVEFMVPFDRAANGAVERMRALEKAAVAGLIGAGAFFSRPYGAARDIVFAQNPTHHGLLKKVKAIFDPGRVLNRGKWGL